MQADTGAERTAAKAVVDCFGIAGLVLEGKYRVDGVVAEGGFGVVYRGAHLTLDRPLAIKLLKMPVGFNDAARAAFIEKFSLEARTIARMSHPNIVQVLDFGVTSTPAGGEAPFMVLEWIHGETLECVLEARRGRGGRSPAETLALLRPVIEALAYAHEEGIAHRDVKPANMMVVAGKRSATLRLMDFGIAKLMDPDERAGVGVTATRSTLNAFSPQYAAPEQIAGTRTGPWTDVHALALIATEVLTDGPAYDVQEATALFAAALSTQRPTPKSKGYDVGAWEPVLERALAMRPDARFQSATEFLTALEAALPAARFVAASAPGPRAESAGGSLPSNTLADSSVVQDVRRFEPKSRASRRRWAVGGGLVALVAVVAGLMAWREADRVRPPRVPTTTVSNPAPVSFVVPPAPRVPPPAAAWTAPPTPTSPPLELHPVAEADAGAGRGVRAARTAHPATDAVGRRRRHIEIE